MKTKIIIGMFLLGLLFCATHKTKDIIEPFDANQDCPGILIQEGTKLKLFNKNKSIVPGVNPVYFNNLDEYTEFVEWQQAKGIKCPILYFQQTYTTQGEKGFRMLPDTIEKNAGLPSHAPQAQKQPLYDATRDDPPYNTNSYAGSDPHDQNIGVYTPLDKLFHSNNKNSDNAMDTNWGGIDATHKHIKQGLYDEMYRPDQTQKGIVKQARKTQNQKPIVVSGHTIFPSKDKERKHNSSKEQRDETKTQLLNRRIQSKQLGLKVINQ